MSRSIMVVFASAECGDDEPQANADKCGARGLAAASQFGLRPHPTRPLRVGRIYACAEKKASVSEALSAQVCG